MTHESFAALLALVGVVIIVSSLLSGAVERTGLPLVAIFLLVGAALGPSGLGLVSLTLESPELRQFGRSTLTWTGHVRQRWAERRTD